MDETERHINTSPVSTANPLSKLFFCWLSPLFKEGNKRKLDVNDMYNVLPEDSSDYLCEQLEKNWEKQKTKLKYGKKPSLRNAALRTLGPQLAVYGIIVFIEEATKVVQPLLLGSLIRYFTPGSGVTKFDAYMMALGLSLCAMTLAISHHPYFYAMQRIGMRLRIASCSLIYKKALRLSNGSLGKTTTGHIVNLLSNDVNRFDLSTLFLHFLWVGPLQALAVLVILYVKLGVASLAGFSVLLLLIPLQSYMGKLFSKLRRKTAVQTDQRVRIMNEILTGIRVIKMYCWEKMFGELIKKVRNTETKCIHRLTSASAVNQAVFFTSAKLLAFITFTTFVLLDGKLTPEKIFVTLGLLHALRINMTLFIPFAVQMLSESRVTFLRIQDFLLLEELEDSTIVRGQESPDPKDCKVTALDITGAWDKTTGQTTLNNVSFEVKAGELLAVIGPVGAGKSSLLMSVLGELPLDKGNMKVTGKLAYAAQQPWIFSASVRQNIIFGQKFNKEKYEKCIRASALTKDLEIMPNHDQTLIGERGVSLSGGQKARISLARALYTESDIYLLDDPLSAVDTAVGKHLFEKCICGVLKDKPRILVTHQLQYLQKADKILILKEGEVLGMGTFAELVNSGIDFTALLKKEEDEEGGNQKGKFDEIKLDEKETALAVPKHLGNIKKLDNYLSKSFDPSGILLENSIQDNESKGLLLEPKIKVELKRSTLSKSLHSLSGRHSDQRMKKVRSHVSIVKSVDNLAHGIGSTLSLDEHISPDFVAPLQEEEHREQGTVGPKIYWSYFRSGANICGLILLLIFNIGSQVSFMMADWWLSYWSTEQLKVDEANRRMYTHDDETEVLQNGFDNSTIGQNSSVQNSSETSELALDKDYYIIVYSALVASVFIFGMVRALYTFHVLVNAAKNLHYRMFKSTVRCPVLFFDTNPVGRILNRFSKDQGTCDELLPMTMFDFVQCALMISGIVILAGIINPWVFIPTVPLGVMFFYLRRYFLRTSRDIKRLEATTRSPVFSHLSATLQGLHTIRAYKSEDLFTEEFHRHQDLHTEAWSLFLGTSRWFAIRLDWLCALFVTSVAFCSVLAAESLNGGLVGLTLTYAINLMGLFQWGVRQSAEVENQMTSVERVIEYSELPPEAPLDSTDDNKPPADWPKHGIISGEGASFKYTDDGPVVLKGINFCVRSSEKVGIAGRTGAGKSSLISMLFRLAEPEGLVMIDGVNIKKLGLHALRSTISIIPQDPVLFTGTVRKNLDPFDLHTDDQILKAVEEVQLKSAVDDLPKGLHAEVSEGGVNFSVGQRQLICLARAILRQNKVLIMDEATANVDPRTDGLIQQTIRDKFRNCTVLTIAHRLHTIMDSDRVMVLNEGKIVEFDAPHELLQNEDSYFYKMVEQTGKTESGRLADIARSAFSEKESDEIEGDDTKINGHCAKS